MCINNQKTMNEDGFVIYFNPPPYSLDAITFWTLKKRDEVEAFYIPANKSGKRIRWVFCHGDVESMVTERAYKHLKGRDDIANVKKVTNSYTDLEKRVASTKLSLSLLFVGKIFLFSLRII